VSFKYDPFGRRIQKSSSSGATNYLYDEENSVTQIDAVGTVLVKYEEGAGLDEQLAEVRGATIGYYEQDGLGSVTSLSGSSAALTNNYSYDSFGNLTASTEPIINPFQYNGRDYDSETGLRYYRARYYDSSIGRFLNEDPIGFAGGFNLYRYDRNNPISFTDPLGLAPGPVSPGHATPPSNCHFPNCFWYYGNWGGPGWTGGQWKPLEDLTSDEHTKLWPPIDAQDACYKEHDYCYSHSRVKNKCTAHDQPTSQQRAQDDLDSGQCDLELSRCLGRLGKDPSWNPASAIAEPLFDLKWLWKTMGPALACPGCTK
jgi:RHS repeat-associated protein